MNKTLITLFALSLSLPLTQAGDWPGWRGPDRTDISSESGVAKSWPADGPKQLWTYTDAGLGYAGPAIVGDTLYTMGATIDKKDEFLVAVDTRTGKERWKKKVGGFFNFGDWGGGPRGTPAVEDGKVYSLAANGNLSCHNAKSGAQVWQVSLVDDFGGKVPKWGYTESPLVYQDKILVTPGGSKGTMLAVNKADGKKAWQSSEWTDPAEYSSIIIAKHHGKDQAIQLVQKSLAGIDPSNGKLLWKTKWDGKVAVIPTPIYHDGKVYISSGYGIGCKLYDIDADKDLYKNKVMKNHHGGVILYQGHLYGHSDKAGWTCQNFETGKVVWQEKEVLGKGAIGYVDGMFICVSETDGTVVLIEASPKAWKEISRFKLSPQTKIRAPKGRIWVHPVVVNGKLYLRDQEIVHCYDISS